MDIIDKYFAVCDLFGDDINDVIIAVKFYGCKIRPSRILDDFEDYTEEKLEKYNFQFDQIIENNKE